MMRYAVVIEKAADNYSAYVPDLPGCIATGETVAGVARGDPIPYRGPQGGRSSDPAVAEYVDDLKLKALEGRALAEGSEITSGARRQLNAVCHTRRGLR
jgi:hypothetical protein